MSTTQKQMGAQYQEVHIQFLRVSATNPRRKLDEAKMKDLVASVKEKGVLEPLLVRPLFPDAGHNSGDKNGHRFEIVAGERRFKAAQKADLKYIPCMVRPLSDAEALEIQVIENLQREDVHPLDEALGYRKLLDATKYDVEALAAKVGKSARYIYQRMQLAELTGPGQKAFLDGQLTVSHAALLCRLLPGQQKQALGFLTEWNGSMLSVRRFQEEIQRHFHLDLAKAPWDLADAELLPKAGACATCPKRAANNPQLFADLAAGDTCTDPDCFEAKGRALVQLQRAKHPEAALVSTTNGYSGNEAKKWPKGTLHENDYRTGKNCVHGKKAVVVVTGAAKTEQLGKLIRICTNRRCRVHYQSYAVERRCQELVLAAVLKKQTTLRFEDLRVVCQTLAYSSYDDSPLAQALGRKHLNEGDIAKMSQLELVRAILGFCLADDISGLSKPKELLSAAKRYGVKVEALRAQAEKELAVAAVHTSAKTKKGTKAAA